MPVLLEQRSPIRIQILQCLSPESSCTSKIKTFAIEKVLTNEPLITAWSTHSGHLVIKQAVVCGDRKALIQLCELGYIPSTYQDLMLLLAHPVAAAILIEHSQVVADQLVFQISHREPAHYPMIEAIMRRQSSIAIGDSLLKEFAFWKLQKFPWCQTRL